MTLPLDASHIVLHVSIPGPPHAQKRHRWARGRIYDPSSEEKKEFLWQLKAACPRLKPEMGSRIGVRIFAWTKRDSEDADNYLKFYMDAMSPPKTKRKNGLVPVDLSKGFTAWGNDNQVDEAYVRVHRGALELKVEIMVYVIPL